MSNLVSEANSPRNSSHSLSPDSTLEYPQYLSQCLNTHLIYDPSITNGLGSLFNESENIGQKILSKIINDGGNMLYDQYLEAKRNDHSINRMFTVLEYVQKLEYLFYDDINQSEKNNGILEDQEPLTSLNENWKGLCINVEKPQALAISKNHSYKDMDQISVAHSRKTVMYSSYDKMKKSEFVSSGVFGQGNRRESSLKSAFDQEKIPKPIDLSVPREIIREEEQLRVLKERETLIKQEKMQMEAIRNQELKEQQQRLKGMQDINKKLFTYDFDGKFILTNPVKMEKLPPFNYAVNHQITKVESKQNQIQGLQQTGNNSNNTTILNQQQQLDQNNEKRNSKRFLQPMQGGVRGSVMQQYKQHQQTDKDKTQHFSSNFQSGDQNREVFEHFNMANGVTLIESNKQKQGAKFGSNLDYSLVNQTALNRTLVEQGNSLRLTKSEYNAITRSGNLSRQNKLDGTMNQDEGQNQSDVIGSGQGGFSFLLNDSKLKNQSQFNSSMTSRVKKGSHHSSSIKIADPSKLIDTLNNLDQINEEQLKELEYLKEKSLHSRKSQSSSNLLRMNPVDEFNLQIQQNRHVSDKKSEFSLPQIPIPKPNEFLRAKQALGFLPQNPRERAPKRVIVASLTHRRLPPPGLGKTIGHGLDQGINPEQIESLEGILERIQNNSMLNGSHGSQILR